MPEYFFYDPNHDKCTLRLEIRDKSRDERKQRLLILIEYSYEHTSSWSKYFVMSGIDYVNFKYSHLISFSSCENSQEIVDNLNEIFGFMRDDWTMADESNLVSSKEIVEEIRPLGLFFQHRSKEELVHCLIRVPITPKPSADAPGFFDAPGYIAFNALASVRTKYRLPILDLDVVNLNAYILLSRQCTEKTQIFRELLFLLDRQNMPLTMLGGPDFDPSTDEYLFVNSGN